MACRWRNSFFKAIPFRSRDFVGGRMLRLMTRDLKNQLLGKLTNKFIFLLLRGLDTTFALYKDYREDNIRDFRGRYLFRTSNEDVVASAVFKDGEMKVPKGAIDDWDVRVTFKDSEALRDFIFSKDQDILDSLLKNEVEVDGNLNYVYKFGFMARDLGHRIGVV